MPPILSEILILLNTPFATDIITTASECKKSGVAEFFTLAISGGIITGILQIISDAVGNIRLKEMYKKSQEALVEREKQVDDLYERKEEYKDIVYILRAKTEMFQRQCTDISPCCILAEEILNTIDQRLPDTTLMPERKDA